MKRMVFLTIRAFFGQKTGLLTTIRILFIVLIPLCSCSILLAQDNIKRIDSFSTTLYQGHELSGNIVVAEQGKIVYERSFGYSDVPHKILNTENHTFQLASVSKIFTSLAILQLKEKGELKLGDPAMRYLPSFTYPGITIRHLLSHTSGLTDFQIFEGPHHADTTKIFSNQDIIPAIKASDRSILFAPGEKWSYSNPGYALLALIVEKISGLSFQEYLDRNIFKPAKMRQTYIASSLIKVSDTYRTKNYDPVSYAAGRLKNVDSLQRYRIPLVVLGSIIGPGSIVSTAHDLLRFDQALYGSKLIKPSTLNEALEPMKLNNGELATMGWKNTRANYGLGWSILLDQSQGKVVFHSGGVIGAVSIFLRNITKNQTVILLDNVTHRGLHSAGVNLMSLLNKGKVTTDKQSLAKIYARALFEKDPDFAAATFNDLKSDTAHYFLDERELNTLGLEMLYDGYHKPALEILKLNCFLFPESFNVYDSYAAALAKDGRKAEAILMYKKSILLNPKNDGGIVALKKLTE